MSRDEFVCENLGLVHACARRFVGRGIEYDDLFQAGCVGLVKAADGFEPERGLCFSTYAVPLILGEMRHLFREGGAVKVSRSLRSLSLKAARLRETLLSTHGREPTVEELAQELGIKPALAAQAVCVALPPLSLTRQVLAELAPQDRALIEMRYLRRQTQQATADQLGMTQVQVSRRERAILLQMRKRLLE